MKKRQSYGPTCARSTPDFDEYQARTDRNIPVFRCKRAG